MRIFVQEFNKSRKQQVIQHGYSKELRQGQRATITDIQQLTKHKGNTRAIYQTCSQVSEVQVQVKSQVFEV